ncbi:MAG: hypothetical protein ACLFQX_10450 [Candidatus Kapaibacterium sp.]
MKKTTLVSRLTMLIGILIAILGLFHSGATSALLEEGALDTLSESQLSTFMFLHVTTGAAIFFSGVLNIYSSVFVMKDQPWSVNILLGNSVFLLIAGILGVVLLRTNLLVYILLLLPFLQLIILMSNRRELPSGKSGK